MQVPVCLVCLVRVTPHPKGPFGRPAPAWGRKRQGKKKRVCKRCEPALLADKAEGDRAGGNTGGNVDNSSYQAVRRRVDTGNTGTGNGDSNSASNYVVSKESARETYAVVRPLGVASGAAYDDDSRF